MVPRAWSVIARDEEPCVGEGVGRGNMAANEEQAGRPDVRPHREEYRAGAEC